jgi:tetratricopeptide (TPR) repeat protein
MAAPRDDSESLRRAQRWPELAELLARNASLAADPEERKSLLLQLANVQRDGCRQQVAAIEALEAALALAPTDHAIIELLARAYEDSKHWKKLIELRSQDLPRIADDAQRVACLTIIARITTDQLTNANDAIDAWRRVLDIDPLHAEARQSLHRLYQRQQRWEDLIALCSQDAAMAETNEPRVAALRKLRDLYNVKVRDPDRAIAVCRELLELASDDETTLRMLRKLYTDRKAWRELEQTYTSSGKFSALVRELERNVPQEDVDQQLTLWRRIGEVYRDELRDRVRAVRAFEQALALAPTDLAIASALAALYDPESDTAAFVAVASIARDLVTNQPAWLEQTRQLAGLCERKLLDPAAAFRFELEVFAIDWRSETTRAEVERLAEVSGQWERLVSAYSEVCAQTVEPAGERPLLPLLAEIAHVQEARLGQPDLAVETSQRILERYGSLPDVLATLERLYLSRTRWADLRVIYERQLTALGDRTVPPGEHDRDARRVVLVKLGRLCEEQLDDHVRAIAAYRELLDLSGYDQTAIDALERVCTRARAWEALAAALTAAMPHADTTARDRMHLRLGVLYELIGDERTAISHYRAAVERCPTGDDALTALERLHGRPHHRRDAAEALAPLYERAGAHAKLATALEAIADNEPVRERRIELLLKIGAVCELELSDSVRAFGAYARALIEAPGNRETLARLESVAEATDGWAVLAEAYRTAFAVPLELSEQIDLRWRLGRIYGEKLRDLPRAFRCFQRVLDLQPGHPAAVVGMAAVLAASERWDDLAKLLGSPLAAAGRLLTGNDLRPAGSTSIDGGDLRPVGSTPEWGSIDEGLFAALRINVAQDPGNLRAALSLARIYASAGRSSDAAAVLRDCSARFRDAGDVRTAATLAASADAASDGSPTAGSASGKQGGAQLQGKSGPGPWCKVIEVRLALAARDANPDRRGQHYYEAGTVYRDRLEQPADALRCFEKAVEEFFHESQLPIVDATVRAIQAIEAIHTAAGAWDALEQCYRMVIARLERRGGAGLLLSMIWESLADLYRHRLGNQGAAAHALQQAWQIRDSLTSQDHAAVPRLGLLIE